MAFWPRMPACQRRKPEDSDNKATAYIPNLELTRKGIETVEGTVLVGRSSEVTRVHVRTLTHDRLS